MNKSEILLGCKICYIQTSKKRANLNRELNHIKKMISRRNFMKVCAIAGSATATTACNASAAGQFGIFDWLRRKPSVSADTTDFSKYQAEAPGEGAASVSNIVSLANAILLHSGRRPESLQNNTICRWSAGILWDTPTPSC